jgi:hypothetical protein
MQVKLSEIAGEVACPRQCYGTDKGRRPPYNLYPATPTAKHMRSTPGGRFPATAIARPMGSMHRVTWLGPATAKIWIFRQ